MAIVLFFLENIDLDNLVLMQRGTGFVEFMLTNKDAKCSVETIIEAFAL